MRKRISEEEGEEKTSNLETSMESKREKQLNKVIEHEIRICDVECVVKYYIKVKKNKNLVCENRIFFTILNVDAL